MPLECGFVPLEVCPAVGWSRSYRAESRWERSAVCRANAAKDDGDSRYLEQNH
jgi:hypothetical protein